MDPGRWDRTRVKMILMTLIEKPFQHFPSTPSSMLVVVQESGRDEQESVGDDLEDHFLPLTEQHKRVENLAYVGVGMILPSPEGIDLSLQPFKCDTWSWSSTQNCRWKYREDHPNQLTWRF